MYRITLLLTFFFMSFLMINNLKAQEKDLTSVEILSSQGVYESAFMIRPEGRYRKIKGTPYLNAKWMPGKVWLEGDSVPANFYMRYNVYGNEMQFIYKQDTFAIANPLSLSKIELDNQQFEYLAFLHYENINMAYFVVITDGAYRLLARHEVRLQAGREPMTPYHPQNEYDRFVHLKSYYLQGPDEPNPFPVPASKKDWYAFAGKQKDELKAFLKEEKIHLTREEDLVKLIDFINRKYE